MYSRIILFALVLTINGDHFTALTDMNRAIGTALSLADTLENYVKLQMKQVQKIKAIVKRIREANLQQKDDELYFANPVTSFNMATKLAGNWTETIKNLIFSQNFAIWNVLFEKVSKMFTLEDRDGIIDSVLRIQKVYQINAIDIARGNIRGIVLAEKLNSKTCYLIGLRCLEEVKNELAIDWFQTGIKLIEESADFSFNSIIDDFDMSLDDLYYNLSIAYRNEGQYEKAIWALDQILQNNKQNEKATAQKAMYSQKLNEPLHEKITLTPDREDLEIQDYEALCNDKTVSIKKPKDSTLKCTFHRPHPYYYYQPIKQEIVHPDPKLVYWYDLLSDKEIEIIKTLATPNLKTAEVTKANTSTAEFQNIRISKSSWIEDDHNQMIIHLNKKIELLTGLSISTAEKLQVVNYGIGGHYVPHFDYRVKRFLHTVDETIGNRIATLIYYLSDVEAGGYTVFNRIGVKVKPVKGGAAFWYNLFPSGEGDLRTRHAACPMIIGSKWVMNKWFHEKGQEFIRPCEIEQGVVENMDGYL